MIGRLTARKMSGEYCVSLDDKPVALVCDDQLFVKITGTGQVLFPDAAEESPYPGAKLHFVFPPERWDNHEALCSLLRATFQALPPPKPRKRPPREALRCLTILRPATLSQLDGERPV